MRTIIFTAIFFSLVSFFSLAPVAFSKSVPQICGYCDGGGGCHWVRDADDYWYWVC